ncbi:hypothetical protein EZS27_007262 [termite gut metagenome]|uniref:Chromosome partition protein Smc n=1 Tax=termite gut metagenome TaxID=433724 RepID=A0A5J4SGW7_9ZZZZ
MKKSKYILLIIIFIPLFSFAQNVTISLEELTKLKTDLDSLKHAVTQKKTIIEQLTDSIISYNLVVSKQHLNQEISISKLDSLQSILHKQDSEIQNLKEQIALCQSGNDALYGRMDTLAVQIGITRLSLKYNPKYSQITVDEFDKIKNEQIKKDYTWVKELHVIYKKSTDKLKEIINEIQNNPHRSNTTNLIRDRFVEEGINKIKQLSYYAKYYNKEHTIIYLDDQIDLCIDLLTQHKKGKSADFGNILKALTYK